MTIKDLKYALYSSPHAIKMQDDEGRISVLNQNKVVAIKCSFYYLLYTKNEKKYFHGLREIKHVDFAVRVKINHRINTGVILHFSPHL